MHHHWSTLKKIRDNCRSFLNQLYTCELCLGECETGSFLCQRCRDDLPYPSLTCPQCSEPVRTEGRCGRCQRHPPDFDYSHCSLTYHHPVTHWMHKCKEGRDIRMAARFCDLMLTSPPLWTIRPDFLVAIPTSRRRLLSRGFNLSEVICHQLSRELNIPVMKHGLRKLRHSEQRLFSGAERRRRSAGIGPGGLDLSGLHLMIIDDVMTTGSTLNEAAQQLKAQGANIVGAWCLARTIKDR